MHDRQYLAYNLYIAPAIDEAAERHSKPALNSPQAMRILVAILLQESDMLEVRQMPAGPGRGFAQFESGPQSGLAGLLKLPSTAWVRAEITEMGWPLEVDALHYGCMVDQRLCAVLARALMWSDPAPLPADAEGAWALYLRTWRPGKPRKDRWAASWNRAGEIVGAVAVPSQPPYQPMPDDEPEEPAADKWVLVAPPDNTGAYGAHWVYLSGAVLGAGSTFTLVGGPHPAFGAKFETEAEAQGVLQMDDRLARQGFRVQRLA